MKTYFISDLHFGHKNIIKFDNRPFQTVEEMDSTLIANWNKTVSNDDMVYILGDMSWYNPEQTCEILKQLKGKKILIKGNHDNIVKDKRCREQFVTIKDYDEIYLNDQLIILSHYPIMYWKNQWHGIIHLYGHVHATRDYDHLLNYIQNEHKIGNPCNMCNVGCMMPWMNYTPRTLDTIKSAYNI